MVYRVSSSEHCAAATVLGSNFAVADLPFYCKRSKQRDRIFSLTHGDGVVNVKR